VGVTVMMWVRWTLPRLRIDQVITTCLKYCVPIAAVMFVGATLWQYKMPDRTFFGLLEMPGWAHQLRERWPVAEAENATPPAAAATEDGQAPLGSNEQTVALMPVAAERGQ
jgi:NADH-quinone oxidoreductase subunit H